MPELSDLDARVLQALPMTIAPRDWLAPADVAERTGLAADVARSVLVRLRGRGLVEDDGERPQRFARTDRAEPLLERSGA